jgi:deoxycytidylate deaminase
MKSRIVQTLIDLETWSANNPSGCARRTVSCEVWNDGNERIYVGSNKPMLPCDTLNCNLNTESGKDLDSCSAGHAEQLALASCGRFAHTMFLTVSPCVSCAKLIAASNIANVFCCAKYSHWERSRKIIEAAGCLLTFVDLLPYRNGEPSSIDRVIAASDHTSWKF